MVKKALLFLVLVIVISCDNSISDKEKEAYIAQGKEITQAIFKELSTNLMSQMKMGGPSQAIPFCNVQALRITAQMSEKYDVTIKRTSDKLRNSKNEASVRELQVLNNYKKELQNKTALAPFFEVDSENSKHFYAPIIVQANCLACHGKLNETVMVKTDSIIKSLYPNDKATGYSEGDLRGVWSITFKN